MPARLYKFLLLLAMLGLLLLASFSQRSLNRDRVVLGVNRGEALGRTAPPALVFTTVALGGFRGLIANALWVRAMELQEEDKFFEKVQLTDWITKLQPRFVSVWIVQAWDMAYNISVKFPNPADRWLWVQRGIQLLRDEALRYNPDEALIYRELAWFFQHKIGADLDDAHFFYKQALIEEMESVLGAGTNYVALIDPQTDDERARAETLRERYKMDPALMQEIDREHGPLDWRLAEAHAIYWATMGLKRSRQHDLITLRRPIYQALQLSFRRGRLLKIPTAEGMLYRQLPNLDIVGRANQAYLDEAEAEPDPSYVKNILQARANFLKDAVYFLYTGNRRAEASQWWDYLRQEYPDAVTIDARREDRASVPLAGLNLEEYVAAKVTEDIGETSRDRVTAILVGLLETSYYYLAMDYDDEAVGHERLAQITWNRYGRQIVDKQKERVGLDPFPDLKRLALERFRQRYSPELVARLYSRLGLPLPSAPETESAAAPQESAPQP